MLIGTTRPLSLHPCPRCLVHKDDLQTISEAELRVDSEERIALVEEARQHIYTEGYVVGSDVVEDLLKGQSLVPVQVRLCRNLAAPKLIRLFRMHSLLCVLSASTFIPRL